MGLEVLRLLARQPEGEATSRQALVQHIPSLMQLEHALVELQHRELIEPLNNGYRFQVELKKVPGKGQNRFTMFEPTAPCLALGK